MVAQSPIPVFLDTVRVPWFDTIERKAKEAIIPARRINVGLPDRADLLADIALKNNGWDQLKVKISSSDMHKVPWHLSVSALALICCLMGIREWQVRLREHQYFRDGSGSSHLPEL
jgi:hypothetical protein